MWQAVFPVSGHWRGLGRGECPAPGSPSWGGVWMGAGQGSSLRDQASVHGKFQVHSEGQKHTPFPIWGFCANLRAMLSWDTWTSRVIAFQMNILQSFVSHLCRSGAKSLNPCRGKVRDGADGSAQPLCPLSSSVLAPDTLLNKTEAHSSVEARQQPLLYKPSSILLKHALWGANAWTTQVWSPGRSFDKYRNSVRSPHPTHLKEYY